MKLFIYKLCTEQVSDTNSQEMHLGHRCTSAEIFQAGQMSVLDPEVGTKWSKRTKVTCYRLTVAHAGECCRSVMLPFPPCHEEAAGRYHSGEPIWPDLN